MVVDEDGARRRHANQRAEHLARMHLDTGDAAARDLDDRDELVAHVDPDREEHLLRQAREARRDEDDARRRRA